jgi:hypothetical protein
VAPLGILSRGESMHSSLAAQRTAQKPFLNSWALAVRFLKLKLLRCLSNHVVGAGLGAAALVLWDLYPALGVALRLDGQTFCPCRTTVSPRSV